jgi:hypothetical protein
LAASVICLTRVKLRLLKFRPADVCRSPITKLRETNRRFTTCASGKFLGDSEDVQDELWGFIFRLSRMFDKQFWHVETRSRGQNNQGCPHTQVGIQVKSKKAKGKVKPIAELLPFTFRLLPFYLIN